MIEKLTFKVVNSAQNCNTGRVFLTPMLKNNTNCQCFQNSLADSPLTTALLLNTQMCQCQRERERMLRQH